MASGQSWKRRNEVVGESKEGKERKGEEKRREKDRQTENKRKEKKKMKISICNPDYIAHHDFRKFFWF